LVVFMYNILYMSCFARFVLLIARFVLPLGIGSHVILHQNQQLKGASRKSSNKRVGND
jgi:hypothetical protein